MAMIPPQPGAGNAPGGPPPGMGQPQPPIGGPPAPMPPPGGALAPPAAPPAPTAAPAQGVPPIPTPSPYSDLSAKMPHAYQLLDAGARTIKMAIETGGFYKQPHVLAGIRKLESDLRRIIQNYATDDDRDTPPRPTNVSDGSGFQAEFLGNEGEDDMPPEDE